MHAGDDAGARQESAEDGQEKREADQEHVPHAQHRAAFLDHGRVHVGRSSEPGETRGILDRVPRPVAAPAELFVGPHHAEDVADGQEQKREQHPLADRDHPLVVEAARDEGRHAERERHGTAHETHVKAGRVDDHPVVLEQRIQALAVRAGARDAGLEGIGREQHQHREEAEDHHQGGDDVRLQLAIAALQPRDAGGDVAGEQERPPQDRSVLPAPQRREQVRGRHLPVAVVSDVADAKVVRHEGVRQQQYGEQHQTCRRVSTEARGLQQTGATTSGGEGYCEGVRGGNEDRVHDPRAQLRE